MMKPLYWLTLILLMLMVACTGAVGTEPAASEAVAPDSVVAEVAEEFVYTDDDASFSINLPAGWTAVTASEEAFAQMRGENGSPSFLTDEFVQALLASGLQMYAVNEAADSLSSGVPVSVQIIRRDAPVSLTLAELVADTANQLDNIVELTSDIEQSTVMLGEDEAIQISYVVRMKTAAGAETTVHNTQYYLMRGGDLYIITLEMEQALVDTYLESSRTAVETFKISAGG